MSTVQPIQALTSLRGIAAWWVVIYHFREYLGGAPAWLGSFFGQGYLAVDLFFILSGFVISLNYGRFFASGPRGAVAFYGLRLARIYPLHLVIMVLFLSVPIAVKNFSSQGLGLTTADIHLDYYVMSLLLIQNWGFTDQLLWNVPAWSISTEFFAYLVFPPLAWGAWQCLTTVPRILGWIALLAAVLAGVTSAFGSSLGDNIQHLGLIRCVLEFCIGISLHRLVLVHPARSAHEGLYALLCAGACFAAYGLGITPDYAVMPVGFLALIYALLDSRLLICRLLQGRFLVQLGLISYSTYLVHYLVKTWLKFLLVRPQVSGLLVCVVYILVTAAASLLLYRLVEVPGRLWMRGAVQGSAFGRQRPRAEVTK